MKIKFDDGKEEILYLADGLMVLIAIIGTFLLMSMFVEPTNEKEQTKVTLTPKVEEKVTYDWSIPGDYAEKNGRK